LSIFTFNVGGIQPTFPWIPIPSALCIPGMLTSAYIHTHNAFCFISRTTVSSLSSLWNALTSVTLDKTSKMTWRTNYGQNVCSRSPLRRIWSVEFDVSLPLCKNFQNGFFGKGHSHLNLSKEAIWKSLAAQRLTGRPVALHWS
jgi:hypothetical protein